jgi:hypothetical protein
MDLIASLASTLNTAPTLAAAFGSTGWLWLGRAPAGVAMPYAVLFDTSNEVEYESSGPGGYTPVVERVTGQASIFADDRAEARALSDLFRYELNRATAPITTGDLMHLWVTGHNVELDPDPGPDGSDVWQAVIRFDASINTSA